MLKEINPEEDFVKIDERLANYIYTRDNSLCQICGRLGTEIHHIIYRSHCGKNRANNLVLLCANCHRDNYGIHGISSIKPEDLLKRIKENEKRLRNNLL